MTEIQDRIQQQTIDEETTTINKVMNQVEKERKIVNV